MAQCPFLWYIIVINMKYKNTLQRGSVRYLIFKERNIWYGVALEFNIVESGDDPREVLFMLFEAIRGFVSSAKKIKARPNILNQKPEKEYEQIWQAASHRNSKTPIKSPIQIYTHGERNLSVTA